MPIIRDSATAVEPTFTAQARSELASLVTHAYLDLDIMHLIPHRERKPLNNTAYLSEDVDMSGSASKMLRHMPGRAFGECLQSLSSRFCQEP